MSKSPPVTCWAAARRAATGTSVKATRSASNRAATRMWCVDRWNFIGALPLLGRERTQGGEVLRVGLPRRDESRVADHDGEILVQHENVSQLGEPEPVLGDVAHRLTSERLTAVAGDEDDAAPHVRLARHATHDRADDPA